MRPYVKLLSPLVLQVVYLKVYGHSHTDTEREIETEEKH